jgi:Zn-dependent peptidase ImmA (M78 family)
MATLHVQLFQSFDRARLVNEIYWNHTEGDEAGRRVSIENLRKSVEKIIGIPVKKTSVDFEGNYIRGFMERYDDRVEIYVIERQTEQWQRFTFVKELCHALCDGEDEWESDGVETLKDLVRLTDLDDATPAMRSERFAEIIALELLYPFEFRAGDKTAKTPATVLAEEFGLPARWIEHALSDAYVDACSIMWGLLKKQQHEAAQ